MTTTRQIERLGLLAVVLAVAGLIVTASPLHLVGAVLVLAGSILFGLLFPEEAVLAILVLFPIHPLVTRILNVDYDVSGTALLLFSAWKEAMLAAAACGAIYRLLREGGIPRVRLHVIDAMASALIVLVAIGLVLHHGSTAVNAARLTLYPVGVYVVLRITGVRRDRFLWAAAISATALAALVVFQSSSLGWGFVTRYWGTASLPIPYTFTALHLEGPRGAGTLASPNEAAMMLALWFCVLVAMLLSVQRMRRVATVVLPLVVLALAMTFSRSAILSAGIAFVVLLSIVLMTQPQSRRLVAPLVGALVVGASLSLFVYANRGGIDLVRSTIATLSSSEPGAEPAPETTPVPTPTVVPSGSQAPTVTPSPSPTPAANDPSTLGHLESLSSGVTLVKNNPLGLGLGTVGARPAPGSGELPKYIIESWFLSQGVALGWLGLSWAIAFPLVLLLVGILAIRRRDRTAGLILIGVGLVVGSISALLPTMMEPQIAMIPWALAALAAGRVFPQASDGDRVPAGTSV